jgi:hypothetical protein
MSNHEVVVLNEAGKVAFQDYLDSGGNFVGGEPHAMSSAIIATVLTMDIVHAASDCMLNFTTMERTLGR